MSGMLLGQLPRDALTLLMSIVSCNASEAQRPLLLHGGQNEARKARASVVQSCADRRSV